MSQPRKNAAPFLTSLAEAEKAVAEAQEVIVRDFAAFARGQGGGPSDAALERFAAAVRRRYLLARQAEALAPAAPPPPMPLARELGRMFKLLLARGGNPKLDLRIEQNEDGDYQWVLVEAVEGTARCVQKSDHSYMTASGAREEGSKALYQTLNGRQDLNT